MLAVEAGGNEFDLLVPVHPVLPACQGGHQRAAAQGALAGQFQDSLEIAINAMSRRPF